MAKKMLLGLVSWVIGAFLANIFIDDQLLANFKPTNVEVEPWNFGVFLKLFFKIFLNNAFIGIIVSVGGYFTAGALTIAVFIWNGFLIGMAILSGIGAGLPLKTFIVKLCFHGPIEVFGFLYLGAIGLSGYSMLKALNLELPFPFDRNKMIRGVALGVGVLFIAAIVESIFYFVEP